MANSLTMLSSFTGIFVCFPFMAHRADYWKWKESKNQ